MAENYKEWKIEDIIKWCVENNQVEWLKATAAKKVEYKIYPRTKVDGKSIADKTQEPKIETRPISFIQLKAEWMEAFGLGEPKKPKKPTMYELIAEL
jgi:hypothetical protein